MGLALLVALAAVVAGTSAPAAAQQRQPAVEWAWLETANFRVAHHPQHRAQAIWYGEFVERLRGELTDLFGTSLDPGLVVRLYPTDADYIAANPAAGQSQHILAHARPEGDDREIGMALTRLERLSGARQVDAFRHELAHLVLVERSGGNLSVGWHEGLAQYVERDAPGKETLVQIVRRASTENRLLPWSVFDEPSRFYSQAQLAYPQSYAVVAYLAEQYGFQRFLPFMDALREGATHDEALQAAFGKSGDKLDAEWRAALPAMLAPGAWPADRLDDRSLVPARAALSELRLPDAVALAARAERFWAAMERPERVDEARRVREEAEGRLALRAVLREAETYLAASDYRAAQQVLDSWQPRAIQAPEEEGVLQTLRQTAERGIQAAASLDQARAALAGNGFVEAQVHAANAWRDFASVSDQRGVAEAAALHAEARRLPTAAGLGLLAVGAASTLVALTRIVRRVRAPRVPPLQTQRLAL